MPTIRDIASKAGVSHAVVSAILHGGNGNVRYSEATKRKVLRIAKQLGYRPHRGARSLALKSALTIGISFAWAMAEVYRHPAMAFTMAGASEVLSRHDYGLLLRSNPEEGGHLPTPRLFHPNEVDGILLVGAIRADDRNLALWRKGKLPMVLMSTPPEGFEDINCVDIDNFGMVAQAVDFLVQRGYRKIGLVVPGFDYTCHQVNLRGFQHALSANGLPFCPKWVWTVGYTPEGGYEFAHHFLAQSDRPEGLVFLSEMAAIGFGKTLMEKRVRLPDELGLVVKEKFPDQLAFLRGIAVLMPSYFDLGRVAAERLIGILHKRIALPVREWLPVPLVVRD